MQMWMGILIKIDDGSSYQYAHLYFQKYHYIQTHYAVSVCVLCVSFLCRNTTRPIISSQILHSCQKHPKLIVTIKFQTTAIVSTSLQIHLCHKSYGPIHLSFLPAIHFIKYIPTIMSFQNGFLQLSPAARRPVGIIRPTQKHQTSHRFFLNTSQKRMPSSIEIHPHQPKDISVKEIIHEKYLALQKRKQKSLHHTFQTNKHACVLERNNNQHISKTIEAVNQYAEQLRLTLIKQYKTQKMKSIRAKKAKGYYEPLNAATEFQTLDSFNDPKGSKLKEETHRNPAYKTLNLLYQAIIDNSFRSRRKEGFQLQAVRLPIVDRFNSRTENIRQQRQINSLSKYDHSNIDEQPWNDPITNYSPFQKTKATFHTHTHKIQWKNKAKTHRVPHEDSQIIPWMVEQQAIFE